MKKNITDSTFKELFEVLNGRIYDAIANGDLAAAKQEIEILERLVKLKKTLAEINPKTPKNKEENPATKDRLFHDLEARLERIRQNNQI